MPESVKSVRVSNGVYASEKSVSGGVYAFANPKKHGRVPPEVISDPDLTAVDVRVFAALAEFERFGLANVGMRYVAEYIHAPKMKVCASIARLVELGHISKAAVSSGQRQTYRLLSPIFKAKVSGCATQVAESGPVHACAECKRTGLKLGKTCYCTKCERSLNAKRKAQLENVDKQVKRVIERLVSQPRKVAS